MCYNKKKLIQQDIHWKNVYSMLKDDFTMRQSMAN